MGGQGKIITLTITQTKGGKTPVDQFNASKKSTLPGIGVEPISGVGDEAFYVSYGGTLPPVLAWSSRKEARRSESRVYGFKDQSKTDERLSRWKSFPGSDGAPQCESSGSLLSSLSSLSSLQV